MTTPEQFARLIVSEPDWCNCTLASGEIDFDRLRLHIAAALRAYAAQERERALHEAVYVAQAQMAAGFSIKSVVNAIRALATTTPEHE